MVRFLNTLFQVTLGAGFAYAILWWLLLIAFGFDLTAWLGLHPSVGLRE